MVDSKLEIEMIYFSLLTKSTISHLSYHLRGGGWYFIKH